MFSAAAKVTMAAEVMKGGGQERGKKLHGRAFYESIGAPKYILAPMVDQSEIVSFRFLVLPHRRGESNREKIG